MASSSVESEASEVWDPDNGDGFSNRSEEQHPLVLVDHPERALMKLKAMSKVKLPPVPLTPAPMSAPTHLNKIPQRLLTTAQYETALERMAHSACGRLFTFLLTLAMFLFAAVGVVLYQERVKMLNGDHWPMMLGTFFAVVVLYSIMPMLSEKVGMHAKATGWKPYLVVYRLSFCTAVPALTCLMLGWGARSKFGEAAGPAGSLTVESLEPRSGKYFEASNGFVALNFTRGIVETMRRTTHGDFSSGYRISRFRDAELLINKEPFTGLVEPTATPGATQLYVIAPVFRTWAPCLTRYRISTSCLTVNNVVAWAIIKSEHLCHGLGMVACRPAKSQLDPVYACSTKPIYGQQTTGPVEGLCGRVILPPKAGVIDELSALLLSESWSATSLPNTTIPWLDVQPDECINHSEACLSEWTLIGTIGAALAFVVVVCIVVPAIIDWNVDRRIRKALAFWDHVYADKTPA